MKNLDHNHALNLTSLFIDVSSYFKNQIMIKIKIKSYNDIP